MSPPDTNRLHMTAPLISKYLMNFKHKKNHRKTKNFVYKKITSLHRNCNKVNLPNSRWIINDFQSYTSFVRQNVRAGQLKLVSFRKNLVPSIVIHGKTIKFNKRISSRQILENLLLKIDKIELCLGYQGITCKYCICDPKVIKEIQKYIHGQNLNILESTSNKNNNQLLNQVTEGCIDDKKKLKLVSSTAHNDLTREIQNLIVRKQLINAINFDVEFDVIFKDMNCIRSMIDQIKLPSVFWKGMYSENKNGTVFIDFKCLYHHCKAIFFKNSFVPLISINYKRLEYNVEIMTKNNLEIVLKNIDKQAML